MLKTTLPGLLVALSALACSSASFADGTPPSVAASNTAPFHYQKALTSPVKLELRDLNGAIHVEPASGAVLEVIATKTGRAEDVARIQIVTREEAGTIVVCAVWPGQDPASCRPGTAPSGKSDEDVRAHVELRVRVPALVSRLEATTVNGAIDAESPSGELNLRTVNGAIDATAKGAISADAVNGAVKARALPGNAVQLASKNGRVELSLPAATNADVQASTLNGHVTSEFGDVPAPTMRPMHDVKLRIGAGGTPISLRTLNGDVRVLRAGT